MAAEHDPHRHCTSLGGEDRALVHACCPAGAEDRLYVSDEEAPCSPARDSGYRGDEPLGVTLLPILSSARRSTRSAQLLVAQAAKREGLLISDLNALARIVDWRCVTPSVLARSLPLDQSSTTELADRLERAGLITRERVPQDRRRVALKPTKKGAAVVADAFGRVFGELIAILEQPEPAERAVVADFLGRVDSALQDLSGSPVTASSRTAA